MWAHYPFNLPRPFSAKIYCLYWNVVIHKSDRYSKLYFVEIVNTYKYIMYKVRISNKIVRIEINDWSWLELMIGVNNQPGSMKIMFENQPILIHLFYDP